MPGLPLLRIPLLAQLEILKHVDVYDLITLTFCSERTRALVESAKVPLRQLRFKFLGSNDVGIRVNDDFYMRTQFTSIKGCQCKEAHKSVEVIWRECFSKKRVVLFQNAPGHDSLSKMLTDHLLGTFRNAKVVNVSTKISQAQDIPIWKYRKTIDNFSVCCDREEKLSEEEINFVFQELTINENLDISFPVVDEFKFSAGFQQKSVFIDHAIWVQFDAILNSKSQQISLYEIENPSAVQLNILLKLWISMGKMENLKELTLRLPSGEKFGDTFLTKVLDGIVHDRISHKWAEIQRVDGKVADVMLDGNTGIWFSTRD